MKNIANQRQAYAFLHTVAKNKLKDIFKKKKPQSLSPDYDKETFIESQQKLDLQLCISRLSQKQKDILRSWIEDSKGKEISTALDKL